VTGASFEAPVNSLQAKGIDITSVTRAPQSIQAGFMPEERKSTRARKYKRVTSEATKP